METTKVSANELLVSIRTANRLTYEYQKRILEFISYFQMKFSLASNQIAAIKRDSNALSKVRTYANDYDDANLKIFPDMWAWDFVYTNLMEYYLGWTSRDKLEFCLSFIQITDSGMFESTESHKSWTSLDTYSDVNKSHSYGFFVIESKKTRIKNFDPLWNVDRDGMESWVKSAKDIVDHNENEKSKYLVFRFDLADIANQSSADKVLARFSDIVKENMEIELIQPIEDSSE